MRHARAPRAKRRGLLEMMLIIFAILSGLYMAWSVTLIVLWIVVAHGS